MCSPVPQLAVVARLSGWPQVGFDRVNTAAYSPRPNTPAAEWDNQVADLVKQDRLNRWGPALAQYPSRIG